MCWLFRQTKAMTKDMTKTTKEKLKMTARKLRVNKEPKVEWKEKLMAKKYSGYVKPSTMPVVSTLYSTQPVMAKLETTSVFSPLSSSPPSPPLVSSAPPSLTPNTEPNSILHTLLTAPPSQHSSFLSSSPDLETFYTTAATSGDTATPEEGEEVDWHYTCFVPSSQKLYELDGDRWGPLEHAILADDESDFGEKAQGMIREYFEGSEGSGKEGMFSVLALVMEESG
jgi:hypothetical protein